MLPTREAHSTLHSLLRLADIRSSSSIRRNTRKRRSETLLSYQALELRQVLNAVPVAQDELNLRTDKQGTTVVGVTVYAALGTPTPSSITANLVFGGQNQGTATYTNTGF